MRIVFLLLGFLAALSAYDSHTCKLCHPAIYSEYSSSIHANSSIYKDKIFNKIWHMHPLSKKGEFKCAKCHTPADQSLIEGKAKLMPNSAQLNNPISCQNCHQIKEIHKGKISNENIYLKKKKYFYSADRKRKGERIVFKHTSKFFGLIESTSGSPYHDIDYSNELYYNGKACLGCHANKKGSNGFEICSLGVKEKKGDKNSCITCHMPKTLGSFVNLKNSKTHANHAISLRDLNYKNLAKFVDLNISQTNLGFKISIKNHANHALFVHPMRLGQLRVTLKHNGKEKLLKPVNFNRVIGKDGKPTMPWQANSVLKDSTIKAYESIGKEYNVKLKKGDEVEAVFGYYIVNPKITKKLKITDKEATKFRVLKRVGYKN